MYLQNYGNPNFGMQQGGYPPDQNYYQQGGYQPQFDTSYQLYNQQPQQTIVIRKEKQVVIKNMSSFGDKVRCTLCSRDTATITDHSIGCVTIVWCLVLSPCLLCCIPCIIDSCKDKQFKCADCKTLKTQSKANCC